MSTQSRQERPAEQVVYTRVSFEPHFDIIRARFVRQRFVPHAHEEFAIGVIEQGIGRLEHENGVDHHSPGSIVAIPRGLVHTGSAADTSIGWGYRMLYLPASVFDRIGLGTGFDSSRLSFATLINDADLARRIVVLHAHMEAHPSEAKRWSDLLFATLGDLVRKHASPAIAHPSNVPPEGLWAARRKIEASFTRPVKIDSLAEVAGMSPFYFIRAYGRAFGIPPYTYLEQLRVQRARELIENGTSIVNAALEVGFADQSHLTRRFKATLGITPGVIARRSRTVASAAQLVSHR